MEMVIGGCSAMIVAVIIGKMARLSDVQIIIMLTMAGGGCLLTGLPYLWLADITVGQSGSPMWIVTGAIGAFAGIIVYWFMRQLPWLVNFLRQQGLL